VPWTSKAQQKWGHTAAGIKALGGPSSVNEWDSATDFGSLPERKDPMADKKPQHWITGAVKHPGALTESASEHGVSKLQEAEKESHSDNPHIRGRGLLGVRMIKRKI
jgi:hypothetical protein